MTVPEGEEQPEEETQFFKDMLAGNFDDIISAALGKEMKVPAEKAGSKSKGAKAKELSFGFEEPFAKPTVNGKQDKDGKSLQLMWGQILAWESERDIYHRCYPDRAVAEEDTVDDPEDETTGSNVVLEHVDPPCHTNSYIIPR
jgi:hypothetical protein